MALPFNISEISSLDISPANVETMIYHFYNNNDTALQKEAHKFLQTAQMSEKAWDFVWEFLQPNKCVEVQFFAASTLHWKLLNNWEELPLQQQPTLREKLMSTILLFSSGPRIVLNRLCIVMATIAIQMLPYNWPNAVEEIVQHLLPSERTQIPGDRSLWILLEILTVLAEGALANPLSQQHRACVRYKLDISFPDVVKLLERLLPSSPSEPMPSGVETTCQAIRCCSAWIQLGIPLSLCGTLSSKLVQTVRIFSEDQGNYTEMGDLASTALTNLLCRPTNDKLPNTVLQLMSETLSLMDIVDFQLSRGEPNEEIVSTIFSILVSVAESHPDLLLDSLLQPETSPARLTAMRLIQGVLRCSNMPGQYPLDENCSQMAFGFWYMLQDDVLRSEAAQYQQLVQLLAPVYSNLACVLLNKSMLPSREDIQRNWSREDQETFRCYRQDVADTLLYCYSILHESLLQLFSNELDSALTSLQTDSSSWRHLETVLHGILSVAEVVPMEEEHFLPRFLAGLKDIPLNQLDVRVAGTVLDAVGAYAEYINQHPTVLGHVIPLLIMGISCAEVSQSATMALKDLTRDCRPSLKPFCMPILVAAKEALNTGHLNMNECVRIMYVVGRVLSVCPLPQILAYLDEVLMPRVRELQELSQQQPSAVVKTNVLLRLKMISTLFSTLDIKPREADAFYPEEINTPECFNNPASGDAPVVQPVQMLLQWLLPVLSAFPHKWASDENVMEALSSSLKYATATLLDDCKPLLPDIVALLSSAFRLCPQASLLDTSKQLLIMFGNDAEQTQLMQSFLSDLISITLHAYEASPNVSLMSDVVHFFFDMLYKLLKSNANLLINSSGGNLLGVFRCGMTSLALPEGGASKAAANFLSHLILESREKPGVHQLVMECGQDLTIRILRCIGGDSPRSGLDPMADLLLSLNKKYCENLSIWLSTVLSEEGFPTARVKRKEKEQFIRNVLRERANKRKLQEIVRVFALICRGLLSEYGEQQSPFL